MPCRFLSSFQGFLASELPHFQGQVVLERLNSATRRDKLRPRNVKIFRFITLFSLLGSFLTQRTA